MGKCKMTWALSQDVVSLSGEKVDVCISCDVLRLPRVGDLHFHTEESALEQTPSVQRSYDSDSTVMGCAWTQISVRMLGAVS